MYKKTRSEGFGEEVKRRIMLGAFVLSSGYYDAYYLKALLVKSMICKAFDKAFEKYDIILGPVAPTTAPKLDASLGDPMKMYLADIYTISVNLAGLPGISVPCGTDSKGLPIGVQMIANSFEEKMFHIIRAFHVAGRCTDCGECSRVCPQNIPLHLLNRKFIKDINELYGEYQAGADIELGMPLTSYTKQDAEPSIVYERGGNK